MARTWIWISGWAINPDRFRAAVEHALPEDSHQVQAPTPDALEHVLASNADCIGGYSLGSLILLSAIKQLPQAANITCLAPFIAFCKEAKLGGTTPKATLQTLQRHLQKQPAKALKLFYRLTGLNDHLTDHLPYPAEHLEWGLEQLETQKADTRFLSRINAVAGLADPLIDCPEMQSRWPTCHFASDCNHDYRRLLAVLPTTLRRCE